MAPARAEDLVPELTDAEPKDAQVDVASTWRQAHAHKSNTGVNTQELDVSEVQTQTVERFGVGVQTDTEAAGKAAAKAVKKAEATLPGFLSRVEGLVVAEFEHVEQEHDALEPLTNLASQEQDPAVVLHTLMPFTTITATSSSAAGAASSSSSGPGRPSSSQANGGVDGDGDRPSTGRRGVGGALAAASASNSNVTGPNGATLGAGGGAGGGGVSASSPYAKLVVTGLSWSCTGQTIAASYGRYDVAGWCTDRGALVTWNLGREVVTPHKPDVTIDVDVCLMACAFHPEHPALVAGGTFNGDVYVWDLSLSQDGDMQRGRSDPLCDIRHQEPICSIAWQYSMTEAGKYGNRAQAYRLVTLGADGRVLVWTWHKMDMPVYAYQLLWPAPGSDRRILWGGTAMSFMSQQLGAHGKGEGGGGGGGASSSHFVVGTEGGHVFKCYYDVSSTSAKEFHKALAAGEKVDVRCPIKEASYTPHAGAVYGVHCCPHHRDLFLTAGADGSVRMYHGLRGTPLMVAEPAIGQLTAVQWSATRPLVFATTSDAGQVFVYDLLQTQQLVRPCLVLDASPVPGQPAQSLAFNSRHPELFATGAHNCITIWRLPNNLSKVRKGEIALLRKLAASDDVMEALQGSK